MKSFEECTCKCHYTKGQGRFRHSDPCCDKTYAPKPKGAVVLSSTQKMRLKALEEGTSFFQPSWPLEEALAERRRNEQYFPEWSWNDFQHMEHKFYDSDDLRGNYINEISGMAMRITARSTSKFRIEKRYDDRLEAYYLFKFSSTFLMFHPLSDSSAQVYPVKSVEDAFQRIIQYHKVGSTMFKELIIN